MIKIINIAGGILLMQEKTDSEKACCSKTKGNAGPAGAVYGLGFIGAAIYYISIASTFWIGVLGFLKAIVWPVFLVYEALKYLGK